MTEPRSVDTRQLSEAAVAALKRQEPAVARPLFERLVSATPTDVNAWLGLALASSGVGDHDRHAQALDRVLAADPGHLSALLMKADEFTRIGNLRAAQTFYRAAVKRARQIGVLSPDLNAEIHRAEQMCANYSRVYQNHLFHSLNEAGFNPVTSSRRFIQAVDLLLGRKQIFLQSPTSFYFPELPQRQFYERSEFPWLSEFEAKTDRIRDELLTIIAEREGFQPYVKTQTERPIKEFGRLRDNPEWSAFYLINGGRVVTEAALRCPLTMEALAKTPLCQSPGRTPSVLFSLLRPGARIPPHTGYTNARLICHLPLIVPDGCALRVGNEVRPWIEGEALVFDDSIEHEAWNESDEPRVVLLFDIWRPELSAEERALVATTMAAVGTYDSAPWV